MSNLLTIKQVAERLQVAEVTVRKWQEQGRITFIKLPQGIRIREEWLEGWLEKKTIKATNKKIA
jgi:excisionase family DNA binding protein